MMDQVIQFEGTIYEDGYGLLAQKVMRDKNLPKQSKLIYAYMCSFAGISKNGERTAFPSVKLQCAELGMSEDTYYKWRKYLIDFGYIKITKQRTEKSRFDRNVYSIIAVPKPVEKTENPYPNNSGMEKNASNQGFSPHPNLSGTEISSAGKSSTEISGTIINSSNSNSFNKDLDTKDTDKTFLHTSFEHQNEQKTKYMENAFYENHEYVPERLANMLRAFSRTPEQAKEFYNIILIAKKNAEKHTEEMIWLEDEPELLEEIINTFSRAIRKIEKERNVKNEKGYIYKSIFDLLTKEISVRQRQGTNNENLYFNWLEEDENYG